MHYRKLRNSDLEVSSIAFGAWQLGDTAYWGETDFEEAERAVHAAIDAGITLFDTAEMYGNGESEKFLGRVLGKRRKSILIASKVWPDNCQPNDLRKACESSLMRLKVSELDLYQIHWPPRDIPFTDVCGEMTRLKEEGKIRAIGVSNFGIENLRTWRACGECVSNQVAYNLIFRAVEHEIVPDCIANKVGVLAYMPVMQGLLAGRWESIEDIPAQRRRTRHFSNKREGTRHGEPGCEMELMQALDGLRRVADGIGASMAAVAMAWLLAQPGVSSVIIGARRADQLKRNLEAVSLTLSKENMDELDRISLPVKERLGSNADMWNNEDDSRVR